MISPLLPFSGGLRAQAPYIIKAITHFVDVLQLDHVFCDPFFGGGSISFEARRIGYTVHSADLARRSVIPAKCLIESPYVLGGPDALPLLKKSSDDALLFSHSERVQKLMPVDSLVAIRGLLENAVTPTQEYVALRCLFELLPMGGFGLMKITEKSESAISGWKKCIGKLDCLSAVVDKVRNIINEGLISVEHTPMGTAVQADAREHITVCAERGASAVHLDPPTYGSKGYINLYWWLDAIIEDKVIEKDKGFTRAEALLFVKECVDCAVNIPVVAITQQEVSYPLKDAIAVLTDAGRTVKAYEVPIANTSNPFYVAIGYNNG